MRYRLVTLILILSLGLALPLPAPAQTVDSSSTQTVVSNESDDDDDGIGMEITLGLFVVVIGVLLWLGLREDIDRMTGTVKSDPVPLDQPSKPEFFMDLNDLPDTGAMTLAEPEYEFAGRMGFQMRF